MSDRLAEAYAEADRELQIAYVAKDKAYARYAVDRPAYYRACDAYDIASKAYDIAYADYTRAYDENQTP